MTLIFADFSKEFDSINGGKMEQILLANGPPKETFAAMIMLYKNTKVKVCSPEGDTGIFEIIVNVLQEDKLAQYLFIICLRTLNFDRSIKRKWLYSIKKRQEADDILQKLLRMLTMQMT